MAKIRADLIGVTTITDDAGGVIILQAGDEIPEGVTVGDHLIETGAPDELTVDGSVKAAPRRRRTAK